MSVIYKYTLKLAERQILKMYKWARILSVQAQNDYICVWALVEPSQPASDFIIEVFATGYPLPPEGENEVRRHLATVQLHNGALVFHVFEVTHVL